MRPHTHLCFLLLLLRRLFLLALHVLLGICLPSRWNPPFPVHVLALILLSFAKVRLSPTLTLSPHDLVLWTYGSVPFGKGGSGVLANCSLCGTEATLSFLAGPVYPYFLLSQTLWQIWQELSSFSFCFIGLQWVLGHSFPRATTRLMSWPDGERYLFPQQFLVISLLLSLVFTLTFSRTGGVLSHQNSSTHRFPRFPLRNLCFYVMHAVFSLVFAAMDTVFC